MILDAIIPIYNIDSTVLKLFKKTNGNYSMGLL